MFQVILWTELVCEISSFTKQTIQAMKFWNISYCLQDQIVLRKVTFLCYSSKETSKKFQIVGYSQPVGKQLKFFLSKLFRLWNFTIIQVISWSCWDRKNTHALLKQVVEAINNWKISNIFRRSKIFKNNNNNFSARANRAMNFEKTKLFLRPNRFAKC